MENAYFRSFDAVVRRQLDPIWHKVGPKTKQLVSDLATLRNLLKYVTGSLKKKRIVLIRPSYLLTYDALSFHAYLETLIASNSATASGAARQNQSPWLFTDAANVIFQSAKRRCYVTIPKAKATPQIQPAQPEDDIFNDPGWEVMEEMERRTSGNGSGSGLPTVNARRPSRKRKRWLPDDMDPVLEELPKWSLLAEVLQEIEEETAQLESTAMSSK